MATFGPTWSPADEYFDHNLMGLESLDEIPKEPSFAPFFSVEPGQDVVSAYNSFVEVPGMSSDKPIDRLEPEIQNAMAAVVPDRTESALPAIPPPRKRRRQINPSKEVKRTDPDSQHLKRRQRHAEGERKRQVALSEQFSLIRTLVPHCSQTGKETKLSILEATVTYIRELQHKNRKLEDTLHRTDDKRSTSSFTSEGDASLDELRQMSGLESTSFTESDINPTPTTSPIAEMEEHIYDGVQKPLPSRAAGKVLFVGQLALLTFLLGIPIGLPILSTYTSDSAVKHSGGRVPLTTTEILSPNPILPLAITVGIAAGLFVLSLLLLLYRSVTFLRVSPSDDQDTAENTLKKARTAFVQGNTSHAHDLFMETLSLLGRYDKIEANMLRLIFDFIRGVLAELLIVVFHPYGARIIRNFTVLTSGSYADLHTREKKAAMICECYAYSAEILFGEGHVMHGLVNLLTSLGALPLLPQSSTRLWPYAITTQILLAIHAPILPIAGKFYYTRLLESIESTPRHKLTDDQKIMYMVIVDSTLAQHAYIEGKLYDAEQKSRDVSLVAAALGNDLLWRLNVVQAGIATILQCNAHDALLYFHHIRSTPITSKHPLSPSLTLAATLIEMSLNFRFVGPPELTRVLLGDAVSKLSAVTTSRIQVGIDCGRAMSFSQSGDYKEALSVASGVAEQLVEMWDPRDFLSTVVVDTLGDVILYTLMAHDKEMKTDDPDLRRTAMHALHRLNVLLPSVSRALPLFLPVSLVRRGAYLHLSGNPKLGNSVLFEALSRAHGLGVTIGEMFAKLLILRFNKGDDDWYDKSDIACSTGRVHSSLAAELAMEAEHALLGARLTTWISERDKQ